MWPFAQKVRCVECGFLGVLLLEENDVPLQPASLSERNMIRSGKLPGGMLYCHRGVIEFALINRDEPIVDDKGRLDLGRLGAWFSASRPGALAKAVEATRCDYFEPYSPRRDFPAHYDSWQRAKEARRNRKQQAVLVLLGAFAGAFLSRIPEILRAFGQIP